jgi:hypothetical protein
MASMDKKRKTQQKWKEGKGWHRANRAKQNLLRAEMKVARWTRYNEEISLAKRAAPIVKHGKRKGQVDTGRFDVTGLQNYIEVQKNIIKMGRFVY